MRLLLLSLFLFTQYSFLLANESIDAQIAKIQQASESERFRLVNELKKQIAAMNANQQARAISKYQEQSLHVEQQVNMANQILHNNQNQRTQDREIVTPQIPINRPNRKPQKIPTPTQKPIVKPETIPILKPSIPVQKPIYKPQPKPTYTKPKPVQKPTYVPKPKPVQKPSDSTPKPAPVKKPSPSFPSKGRF